MKERSWKTGVPWYVWGLLLVGAALIFGIDRFSPRSFEISPALLHSEADQYVVAFEARNHTGAVATRELRVTLAFATPAGKFRRMQYVPVSSRTYPITLEAGEKRGFTCDFVLPAGTTANQAEVEVL